MSTDDATGTTANDVGGAGDMLPPMEGTDSDDMRNADGDDVVDPPEHWSGVDKFGMSAEEQSQGESLDARLAEEVPDVSDIDTREAVDAGSEEPLPATDPVLDNPGVHEGQVGAMPEGGPSLFPIVE